VKRQNVVEQDTQKRKENNQNSTKQPTIKLQGRKKGYKNNQKRSKSNRVRGGQIIPFCRGYNFTCQKT
jgi:hypothetical protein